jgi:predicted DNA-binding transcriptional regulator YafY
MMTGGEAEMKIDRLIGIITILMQKQKVTIPQLAKRYEVSGRTIQRDIDSICRAGIPIVSAQGYGGGLWIADGYHLDQTVLTEQELQAVLTGVKSLDSVSKTAYRQTLIEKLTQNRKDVLRPNDTMVIDLASWYQESLTEKIELIQQAILRQEMISFTYYSSRGEAQRTVEPCVIVYEWSAWYVYGYCTSQNGFRLFKLNRLWSLVNTRAPFSPRELPDGRPSFKDQIGTEDIHLSAVFHKKAKYRLIEEYGPQCFTEAENGTLLFQRSFANRGYLLQWLLSFGDQVRVLSPPEVAADIRRQAQNTQKYYE